MGGIALFGRKSCIEEVAHTTKGRYRRNLIALQVILWCSKPYSVAYSTSSPKKTIMTDNGKPLIIFCHGSGDTGYGAKHWIQSLIPASEYQQFRWLFPSAKKIPYQLSGGAVSSVWYDRVGGFAPSFPEQIATIESSADQLMALIDDQVTQGVSPLMISIGGFSMGGAIALQTAARWHARNQGTLLGGVFGLSCYLNDNSKVWTLIGSPTFQWPRVFMAHGASDDFILSQWGQTTWNRLERAGVKGSFRLVPRMHHDMTSSEILQLLEFLTSDADKKEDCTTLEKE